MAYMKAIKTAKQSHTKMHHAEFEGAIDLLIVSPPKGEMWFLYIKKEQLSKDGAFPVVKKFIKEYKHDSDVRWSFTFAGDRWHSVRRGTALPCTRPPHTGPM